MADEDDEDLFGDFNFNSNPQSTFPSMTGDSFDNDDDDWGDFVATPFAQINGRDSPADSAPSLGKPSGALPLSLFGEAEDENSNSNSLADESVFGYGEPVLFNCEGKKTKGSSLNGGVSIGELISDLFEHSEKFGVRKDSVADLNSDRNRNRNGIDLGIYNVDSSSSKFNSGSSGLNSSFNGLSSVLLQQSDNFDDDDDDYGWEFKGADGNNLVHTSVEEQEQKAKKVEAKESEIQVNGSGRVEVEELKSEIEYTNGFSGSSDSSIQSSNTTNEVGDWNSGLALNPSFMNQDDSLWDSYSKSKEASDIKIRSTLSYVAENINSNNNFWQFKDALFEARVEPQLEAAKVSASADLGIQTVNGDGSCTLTNFFAQSERTFLKAEQWNHISYLNSSPADQVEVVAHVTLESKENGTGKGSRSSQDDNYDEFEADDWEFRDAYSDTGSKNEGNKLKLGNDREALPLSLFGDELEINVASVGQDFATHTAATYARNTKSNSSSSISINDLLSSLYNQAEQNTSVHDAPKASENKPQSIVRLEESDLVYPDDDFGDDSWEFKDASHDAKAQNQTFVTRPDSPTKSSIKLPLNYFIDFYSRLKEESCYIALNHFETLKKAESTNIEAFSDDIQKLRDQLCCDNMISEFHLDNLPQRSSGISELYQALDEPKFSVLDSEFHLSNLLSLAEKDLESAIKLSKHATSTLQILELGSADEQYSYVSTWSRVLWVCAQQLKHGASLWDHALQKRVAGQIISELRGREYLIALGEIYRVVQVLGASIKLYKPWVMLNSEEPNCLCDVLNECTSLWSSSGLGEALQSISEMSEIASDTSLTELLGSIEHIYNLDVLALYACVFCGDDLFCRLSMLTPSTVPGIKLVTWEGDQYLLKVANLWANLISPNPPKLPKLNLS